jgi:hypothetical protein
MGDFYNKTITSPNKIAHILNTYTVMIDFITIYLLRIASLKSKVNYHCWPGPSSSTSSIVLCLLAIALIDPELMVIPVTLLLYPAAALGPPERSPDAGNLARRPRPLGCGLENPGGVPT